LLSDPAGSFGVYVYTIMQLGIADNGIQKKLRAGEKTLWCADDGSKIAAGLVYSMSLLVYIIWHIYK